MNDYLRTFARLCGMTTAGGVLLAGTVATRGAWLGGVLEQARDAAPVCVRVHVVKLGGVKLVFSS